MEAVVRYVMWTIQTVYVVGGIWGLVRIGWSKEEAAVFVAVLYGSYVGLDDLIDRTVLKWRRRRNGDD